MLAQLILPSPSIHSIHVMPALETFSTSPASPDLSPLNKSTLQSPRVSQSLAAFSASGTIHISPRPQKLKRAEPPSSPPSYNTAVRYSTSPTFNRSAEIQPSVQTTTSSPLARPSTSPASTNSSASDAFALAADLREAHQQLLIQKHAIAAALGSELTALKEERVRERRQHATVMRRMEEEVKRMEERTHTVEVDNDRIKAELATEKERREQEARNVAEIEHITKLQEESKEQHIVPGQGHWDETENEASIPIFHSEPPSSRPSISCPLPTRQSAVQVAPHPGDDEVLRQMLDVIQQLKEQIAAIRLSTVEQKLELESKQPRAVSETEAVIYGPGHVWREYEPLMFCAVQPIVFHRTRHYTHYDVSEWGR